MYGQVYDTEGGIPGKPSDFYVSVKENLKLDQHMKAHVPINWGLFYGRRAARVGGHPTRQFVQRVFDRETHVLALLYG